METGVVARLRVAVVSPDPALRARTVQRLSAAPGVDVRAWSEDADLLLLLDTRVDVCLCSVPPPAATAGRLRERGCACAVLSPDGDPLADLDGVAPVTRTRRPRLAARQREVLVAYAGSNDLLPRVARTLGMERETLKTHLRRIRAKYADVGRPAPTRHDLYLRAVEDGLLAPPSGEHRG